jgi:hypothetical protein
VSLTLKIPTINDKPRDFDCLFQLCTQVNQDCSEVILDFSKCRFLRPNAVAFLGGLTRLITSQGREVIFKRDTLHKNVKTNLQQNGFMRAFCQDITPWQGNSIPYREDLTQNKDELVDYLAEQWLGRGWVHVSPDLQRLIREIRENFKF